MIAGDHSYFFEDFELNIARRVLRRNGENLSLNPKTLDLLVALVENRGRVMSKSELLDRVWANQFVEENNLTVHVAALRKVLGETRGANRFIVTLPGKGYQFVADFNGHTNGDVVYENHSFERIIYDEQIVEESGSAQVSTTPVRFGFSRRTVAFTAIAAVAVGVALTGYFLLSSRSARAAAFVQHSARQLTTNGKVGKAALSRDGKLFAYTIDDLGQKSLWLGNVEGGNHVQLRPASEVSFRTIVFSPDSSHLYYSLRDEKNPNGALYKIPVLGGIESKIADRIGTFALSPDASWIAAGRADRENNFVTVAEVGGGNSRDVASFPKNMSFTFDSLSWSPDGQQLAMSVLRDGRTYYHDLAIVDVGTGSIRRLPVPDIREITKTEWLDDASGLVITAIEESSHSSVPQYRLFHFDFASGLTSKITTDRSNYGASWHNDAGATLSVSAASDFLLAVEHRQLSNVWVAPANDLSAVRQITFSSFGKYDGLWGMDWTPAGKLIYTTSDTTSQFLASMNGDGTDQRAITAPGQVDSVLTVSGDGRYILFHSNRAGDFDIWRADIDGGNAKQLTFGGQGFMPTPSPDGKWVYYKNWLRKGVMCRVPTDGGEPECVTDAETSWMSFSPDGRYIAGLYSTDRHRLAIFDAADHRIIRQFDLPKTATLFMGSRWMPDGKAVTYRDNSFGYWVQSIDGGEPKRLEGLPKEKFYNFSWSRDGKWLAFVGGQEIRDVVLFKNVK